MQFRDRNSRFAEQFDLNPEVFAAPAVVVEIGVEAARHQGNVACFLLAVSLLSRTFEQVHAVFPTGTRVHRHPWNLGTVDEVVSELSHTADTDLKVGLPARADVALSVSEPPEVSADREIVVSGSEWHAALDCKLEDAGNGVFGCLYASTIGAAQVMLHALDFVGAPYKPMRPFKFSLLDLQQSGKGGKLPREIRIPETHLVGVGAVGSTAVYALAHLEDVQGAVNLIDNDSVDESNLNRYVLMSRQDIGEWKVDVAARALRGTSIQAIPYRGAFANYDREHGSVVNLLLSPVDSEEGRRELARTLPRRIINAATGGTTVTVSTHGFADGKACLFCVYMPEENQASPEQIMAADVGLPVEAVQAFVRTNALLDARTVARIESHRGAPPGAWTRHVGLPIHSFYERAVCGDAEIHLPTSNVVAPLAFISAAAGVLLAAELTKLGHPDLGPWALDNYLRIDTLSQPNPAFRRIRMQETSGRCICWDPDYVDVHRTKYAVT